jgi:hypothetical protein
MNLGLLQSFTKQLDARGRGISSNCCVCWHLSRHTARFAVTTCTTISQKLKSAAMTKLLRGWALTSQELSYPRERICRMSYSLGDKHVGITLEHGTPRTKRNSCGSRVHHLRNRRVMQQSIRAHRPCGACARTFSSLHRGISSPAENAMQQPSPNGKSLSISQKRVASSSDAARWEQQRLSFDGWASRIEFFSCTRHSWRRVAAQDPNRRLQKPEAPETTRRKSRNQSRKSKVATLCY